MPKFGYNDLAQQIFDLVSNYCRFPGPILDTQCQRLKKSPMTITADDLPSLASWIKVSVANFTNPEKGLKIEADILSLRDKVSQ